MFKSGTQFVWYILMPIKTKLVNVTTNVRVCWSDVYRQGKATNDLSVEQALSCRWCVVLALSEEPETSILV